MNILRQSSIAVVGAITQSLHTNFIKTVTSPGLIFNRGGICQCSILWHQQRAKTRWVRSKAKFAPAVPSFDYSGDKTLDLIELDTAENVFTALGIDSSEIAEADKDTFSISNADHQQQMALILKKTVERFGRHEFDMESPEVKIALMTMRIRNLIRHVQQFPKDKLNKSRLVESIQMRKKRLTELQRFDVNRFEWLCNELKLTYTPNTRYNKYIPRRSRLRTEAVREMIDMKESKLAELKEQLALERKDYYTKKSQLMEEINEEKEKLSSEAQNLQNSRIQIGYAGNLGDVAFNLAHIKPINREKWWRKHPEVLKLKYGAKARIPKAA